jgi:carbonic anhydrase
MKTIQDLLAQNQSWAARHIADEPRFFDRLSEIQRPDYLWIGCSDSRVPANEIVGLAPGELFVHRNVANIVVPGDANCMATVQYAIEVLGVRHVMVCGHYGCGGVRAALENRFDGASHVERWLSPLRQLAVLRAGELAECATDVERWDRLCELNVIDQVRRLSATDVVSKARLHGVEIFIYGLTYSLRDGLLRELVTPKAAEQESVLSSK